MILRHKIDTLSEDELAMVLYILNVINKIVPEVDKSLLASVKEHKLKEKLIKARDSLVDKDLDIYIKLCEKFGIVIEKTNTSPNNENQPVGN